ncbi:MAG: hypothetical protein AB1589_37795 [Cyanobacteriota bacterium]
MKRVISLLKTVSLGKAIAIFLSAITFLVVPAFTYSQSFQANAGTMMASGDSYTVDQATVKKIQDRAEDLGNSQRDIGDTGLKNIKNLGENIPETLGMRARQDSEDALNGEQKNTLNEAQNQVKGAFEGAKRAVQDATR